MARKKSVGRMAGMAPGTSTIAPADTSAGDLPATSAEIVGGIAGGLAAAEAAGNRVRHVEVTSLVPHPLNDPQRSLPGQGPKWDELVNSIASLGVESPAVAVTREAFVRARPAHAANLPPEGRYVLVFGHRRRIAALTAGVKTMPIIVNDAILNDNGDLDAMAAENLGREDLSPLAEARLFARYVDEIDLTQSAIGKRLGFDQANVSRRLALLLLTDEGLAAVESGQISPSNAATLAGGLPYGPVRKWQRTRREDEQNSPQRREDQNTALSRILAKDGTPQKIVDFVLAERQARKEAQAQGIDIVADPTEALGGPAQEVPDPQSFDGDLVGTIDSITGALLLWGLPPQVPTSPADPAVEERPSLASPSGAPQVPDLADEELPTPSAASEPARNRSEIDSRPSADDAAAAADTSKGEAAQAASARLEACQKAAEAVPAKSHMAEILAQAIANGIDTSSPRVIARADTWATGDGGAADSYTAVASIAWRRVLSGYERAAETAGTAWGPTQRAYLQLLSDRAGFTPSPLERRLMRHT